MGDLIDGDGGKTIDGCGFRVIGVSGQPVIASFSKNDTTSDTLCVSILSGTDVLKSECTSAAFGNVAVGT
ncbi:MAG: hypothetical protein ACYDBQ_02465 [Thermoplasmatota archaeon]